MLWVQNALWHEQIFFGWMSYPCLYIVFPAKKYQQIRLGPGKKWIINNLPCIIENKIWKGYKFILLWWAKKNMVMHKKFCDACNLHVTSWRGREHQRSLWKLAELVLWKNGNVLSKSIRNPPSFDLIESRVGELNVKREFRHPNTKLGGPFVSPVLDNYGSISRPADFRTIHVHGRTGWGYLEKI